MIFYTMGSQPGDSAPPGGVRRKSRGCQMSFLGINTKIRILVPRPQRLSQIWILINYDGGVSDQLGLAEGYQARTRLGTPGLFTVAPERIWKWGDPAVRRESGGPGRILRKAPEKKLVWSYHSTFLALISKSTISRFGERFVMVSTVWSVSCLLFFYSQCPRAHCPGICKSGLGARAPEPYGVGATVYTHCFSSPWLWFTIRNVADHKLPASDFYPQIFLSFCPKYNILVPSTDNFNKLSLLNTSCPSKPYSLFRW